MKSNNADKIVERCTLINFCCSEIMSSVSKMSDKQYVDLFNSLCDILGKSAYDMNREIKKHMMGGSPRAK